MPGDGSFCGTEDRCQHLNRGADSSKRLAWVSVGDGDRLRVRVGQEVVFDRTFGYDGFMTAVPLGEARDRLSEYVTDVERTHERVTITRHGHPAAVLISADDLASLEETLEILGTPGAVQAIREGQADAAAGRFADNHEIKARFGVA